MSYAKAIKWGKKHPKGTRQPVVMHTNSGFWPSHSFLKEFWKYQEACKASNVEPLECKPYYDANLCGHVMACMDIAEQVRETQRAAAAQTLEA